MTNPDQCVMDFLLTRRSRPYKTLTTPAPTREQLAPLLTAAARVPDHGKLEPWRFILLTDAALSRLASLASHETVAGFIHIGTRTSTPPERPRPDVTAITEWTIT